MAVDVQRLFNEELPAALAKNADDAKTLGAKYQMNITGPGGGEWIVDVSASGPSAFCDRLGKILPRRRP